MGTMGETDGKEASNLISRERNKIRKLARGGTESTLSQGRHGGEGKE